LSWWSCRLIRNVHIGQNADPNEAGFEYGYAEASGRKPIVKKVNLLLQEAVGSFGIAG